MSFVLVHDAIHQNISHLPTGRAAGYTTGTDGTGGTVGIKWTAADWAAHPGAVRICQDAGASDHTADVLDVENGAATLGDCAPWYRAALANFAAAARPGQRHPMIYTSASNVTNVANALIAGGVKSGPNLWIANWNLSDIQATLDVSQASGPFPVEAVQFSSGAFYDTSVYSSGWLGAVSAVPKPPPPGGGPYRKLFTGKQSWNSVARIRNTNAGVLQATTDAALTAEDKAIINNEMRPKGEPYYTINQ